MGDGKDYDRVSRTIAWEALWGIILKNVRPLNNMIDGYSTFAGSMREE